MKKHFSAIALGISLLALASCGGGNNPETTTATQPTTSAAESNVVTFDARYSTGTLNDKGLADDIQDGTILHAWNWSYNTIKENMEMIAKSGYTAVQTSPVQQCKSTIKQGSWSSEWYKLYQPVAFSIAEDSYLGTKEELAEMCEVAESYGVKVIVDIVSNHLGNDNTGAAGTYAEAIETYEPEIFANKNQYFHNTNHNVSDDNAKTVTYYMLSNLPDLNTSNEYVQGRVISLLEECIDCGVDGFRFDAAKHIETPDDGGYASNYWPNVLSAATKYADETYGTKLYYYGEILNTCGGGRKYDSYTKYLSITDNKYGTNIQSKLSSKYILNALNYSFSDDGTKAVVWAESHDTYADGSTQGATQDLMNRIYAFEAARSGAAPLYFARPNSSTVMGAMGTKAWKSAEIAAINNFHNAMLGKNETISYQNSHVLVERGTDGVAILSSFSVREDKEVEFEAKAIADGKYYDHVTGKEVVVSNGVIKGTMSTAGIMVLMKSEPDITPEVILSSEMGYFYNSYDVTVSAKNATSASYNINGGEEVSFDAPTPVTLTPDDEGVATLTVTVKKDDKTVTEVYKYYQVEKRDGYVAISGLKDTSANRYLAWVWPTGKDGHWEEVVVSGDVAYIAVPVDEDGNSLIASSNYLLASFPKDYDIESLYGTTKNVWDDKTGQTSDYKMQEDVIQVCTI